jgi:hypothetical protein
LEHLTLWEKVWLALSAVVVWLGGEVGRAAIAGAAGGLLRYLMQERLRFRDGIVSVTGGVIASIYLGPVVGAILTVAVGPIADAAASGFIAGLAGMSLAKVIVAIVETQAKKLAKGSE